MGCTGRATPTLKHYIPVPSVTAPKTKNKRRNKTKVTRKRCSRGRATVIPSSVGPWGRLNCFSLPHYRNAPCYGRALVTVSEMRCANRTASSPCACWKRCRKKKLHPPIMMMVGNGWSEFVIVCTFPSGPIVNTFSVYRWRKSALHQPIVSPDRDSPYSFFFAISTSH